MERPDRRIQELAQRFLDNTPLYLGADYDACVDSLALELDAAISDRWIEWSDARKSGWPLDRPLVERGR